MAVQDAGEDEVGERDGVLGGLADGIGQVPAVETFVECEAVEWFRFAIDPMSTGS